MHRRRFLTTAIMGSTALLLTGCGFRLRGTANLPFDTIYLEFPETSELGARLARSIRMGTQATVVKDPELAQARLYVVESSRSSEQLSLDAQGRVRDKTLIYRFVFRVVDKKGIVLLEPTTINITRRMSNNDAQLLSQELNETTLYREMETDIAQRILAHLEAIKRQ